MDVRARGIGIGLLLGSALVVGVGLLRPALAQVCSGDCNADLTVAADELSSGIDIAYGDSPLAACAAADANGDGSVRVSDIVAARNASLGLACTPPGNPHTPPGTVSIDIGVVSGTAGATVAVPVTLDDGGFTLAGIQIDIGFDPLTPILANQNGGPDCSRGGGFQPPGCTPGVSCTAVRVLMIQFSPPLSNGVLFTCNVSISSSAPPGTYPLPGSTRGTSDPSGNPTAVNGADGAIIVLSTVDTDGDGVLDEVDNCPTTANADQSDVDADGAGDVCDANDTPSSLVVSVARLRQAPPAATRGMVKVRALLNDNDSAGSFETSVLATGLGVRVQDAAGFDAAWTFPACQRVGSGGRIDCRSADRRRRASFQPSGQGPFLYRLRLSATNLSPIDTGAGPLAGPVRITLVHGALDRVDSISVCAASRATGLSCKER